MSKKRAPQTELNNNNRLSIDPSNMVVLRAGNGNVFLIEKNCAMVSRKFRELLSEMEAKISMAVRSMDESINSGEPPSDSLSFKEKGIEVDCSFPFFDIEWEVRPRESDSGKSMFKATQIIHYWQKHNSERVQSSDCPVTSSKNARSAVVSSAGHRRSYLSCLEMDNGVKMYPLFDFPEIDATLLDLAIRFMYLKYRLDSEPEKRQQFHFSLLEECNAVRLIAISDLLGM